MPRYAITEKAGLFVAARRNTGVGTILDLTERQAEHELRLGTLVRIREASEVTAESSAALDSPQQIDRIDAAIDRRRRPARKPEPSPSSSS